MDPSLFFGIVHFKIFRGEALEKCGTPFITPFLNNGPVHIKRWKSPFLTFRDESLCVRNSFPFPKEWTHPFSLE